MSLRHLSMTLPNIAAGSSFPGMWSDWLRQATMLANQRRVGEPPWSATNPANRYGAASTTSYPAVSSPRANAMNGWTSPRVPDVMINTFNGNLLSAEADVRGTRIPLGPSFIGAVRQVRFTEAAKEPTGSRDHQQETGDAYDWKLGHDSCDDHGEPGKNGQDTVNSARGCPVPGPSGLQVPVQIRVCCGQFLFELFEAPALLI